MKTAASLVLFVLLSNFCVLHAFLGKQTPICSTTKLAGGKDFLDSFRKFFDPSSSGPKRNDNGDDSEIAGVKTIRVVTIPVKSLKPGGLRLFLMFYLLGMQNTPDRNSWRADQPVKDDSYVLNYFFHDQSAMLSIQLRDREIDFDRVGSSPSNAYMMQEAMIVEGILRELDLCAFDEKIGKDDRLIILDDPQDAIDKAREALSFG